MGGGGGRGRCDHLKEDFRRRMVSVLGFERSGAECGGGEVVFKYEKNKQKKKSGDKVDLRGGDGTGELVVTGEGGGGLGGDKICADCRTSKTPLWRNGPHGPKTLCNACGIRYRKLRRKAGNCHANSGGVRSGRPLSLGISSSESELLKQKQRRKQEDLWLLLQQSRKFEPTCGKEEAEAAVLLMALSTGLFVHV